MSRALARHGRFVRQREHLTTSGRKLQAHSGREVLGLLARLTLGPGPSPSGDAPGWESGTASGRATRGLTGRTVDLVRAGRRTSSE